MKVLLLGIDALDRLLLEKFSDFLPNIAKMKRDGVLLPVLSTFPPDSDTAWATVATGWDPAKHGIVYFVDPLEKSYRLLNLEKENEILRGNTFWDKLGKEGKSTISLFPHLCHPVWETPGIMVGRGNTEGCVSAYPESILDLYPDKTSLMGVGGFPDRSRKGMIEFAQRMFIQAEQDAEFALQVMDKEEWDLMFVYSSSLDGIGHYYWNYYDEEDIAFVEDKELRNVIPDAYKLIDKFIGKYLNAIDEDTIVMILSDHGQGGRPNYVINVNKILHQGGFLKERNIKQNPHIRILENIKKFVVKNVNRFGLGKVAGLIIQIFPNSMKVFTRPNIINWEETIAFTTDMSGIKAYTYGGVKINSDVLDGKEYETTRSQIIELIKENAVDEEGNSLLVFICRREDMYSGPFIDKYPDIILEFKYGYGLGWKVDVPLIIETETHKIVPGSHRGDTGIFMMLDGPEIQKDIIDLRDIAPSILSLFGVPKDDNIQGVSFFK